jgi:hypothetical protein
MSNPSQSLRNMSAFVRKAPMAGELLYDFAAPAKLSTIELCSAAIYARARTAMTMLLSIKRDVSIG